MSKKKFDKRNKQPGLQLDQGELEKMTGGIKSGGGCYSQKPDGIGTSNHLSHKLNNLEFSNHKTR